MSAPVELSMGMPSMDAYRFWRDAVEAQPLARRDRFADFKIARLGVTAGASLEEFLPLIGDLCRDPHPDQGMYIPRLWLEFLAAHGEQSDGRAMLINHWIDGIHAQRNPFWRARETIALVQTAYGVAHPDEAADLIKRASRLVIRALPPHRILDTLYVHPTKRVGTWKKPVRPDAFAAASGFVYGAQEAGYGNMVEGIDAYLLQALKEVDPSRVDGYVTGYLLLHTGASEQVTFADKLAAIDRVLDGSKALPEDGSGKGIVQEFAVRAYLLMDAWDGALSLSKRMGNPNVADMRVIYLLEHAMLHGNGKLDELRLWRDGLLLGMDEYEQDNQKRAWNVDFLLAATQVTGEGTYAMDKPEILEAIGAGEADFNLPYLAQLSRKHPGTPFAEAVRERIAAGIDALDHEQDPDLTVRGDARRLAEAIVYLNASKDLS